MEAFVAIALAVVVACLIAVLLELRELRKAFDSLRMMAADAVGIPPGPDLIERTVAHDAGTVNVPTTLSDILSDYEEDQGDELEAQ
jgi:hypothetical protein